jgi:hypothetical protein
MRGEETKIKGREVAETTRSQKNLIISKRLDEVKGRRKANRTEEITTSEEMKLRPLLLEDRRSIWLVQKGTAHG